MSEKEFERNRDNVETENTPAVQGDIDKADNTGEGQFDNVPDIQYLDIKITPQGSENNDDSNIVDNNANDIESNTDTTDNGKIGALLNSVPKPVFLLILRFFLSALLLGISFISQLPHGVIFALRIAGFAISAIDVAVKGTIDIIRKEFRSYPALLFLLGITLMVIGQFIEASVVMLLYSALLMCFEYLSKASVNNIFEALEHMGKQNSGVLSAEKTNRIKNSLGELKSGSLSDIRNFKSLYNKISLVVLAVSLFIALIIPLLDDMQFKKWIYRAAIIASTAAFVDFATVIIYKYSIASDRIFSSGVFISSVEDISSASLVSSIVFSKTGILTAGHFNITNTSSDRLTEEQLLLLAAYAEAFSIHPIAKAIRHRSASDIDTSLISWHEERPGLGSVVRIRDTIRIAVGSAEYMEMLNVSGTFLSVPATSVFVAVGNSCVGRIDLQDPPRDDATNTINEIKKLNVANVAIMTGDNTISATNLGRAIGITEIYADYQPDDKLQRMQYIIGTLESDDRIAYVGDGIHDSQLLNLADLGIVLNHSNSDEICLPEVIIDSNELHKVAYFLKVSKELKRFTRTFALSLALLDLVIIALSILGAMFLWTAILVYFCFQFLIFDSPNNLIKTIKYNKK